MNRCAIVLMAALTLGGAGALAQTMPAYPAPPQTSLDGMTRQDSATSGTGSGNHSDRGPDGRASERGDDPPASPPLYHETVGVGGSVDRAPRDIREPFDE